MTHSTKVGSRGLGAETQRKYLCYLSGLLRFCGNRVIDDMKAEGVRLPKERRKEIRSLVEDDLATIQQVAESMVGWYGDIARFMVWIIPYTGARPKELRLAHLEDLNTRTWELRVRHPKGEGSWGNERTVIILEPARPAVLRFLDARKKHLKEMGDEQGDRPHTQPPMGQGRVLLLQRLPRH